MNCLDDEVGRVHVPTNFDSHRSEVRCDFLGGALVDHVSVVKDDDTVHEFEQLTGRLMDGAENSHAHMHFLLHGLHDFVGSGTVETTSGFVQQHHPRISYQLVPN